MRFASFGVSPLIHAVAERKYLIENLETPGKVIAVLNRILFEGINLNQRICLVSA